MKGRRIVLAAWLLLASACAGAAAGDRLTPEQQARLRQIVEMEAGFHPQTGDVSLPEANAVLHLGKGYYYLPPAEAKRVIVDGWGNPPSSADGNLGLVFESGKHFYDDTWGAVITYDPMGYVTDDDARSADYGQILSDMQSGEEELNARRQQEGYPAEHLVGWAQPPSYDPASHSVVWAQNIAFAGQSDNSLNYDIRLLGRRGVLSLNMVTTMSKLGETRTAAEKLAHSAEFSAGSRYADYQEGVDTKAGIGIAGLVAAGVGVAAAKKLGFLALLAVFAKKALVLILAAFAAVAARFRKWFRRGEAEEVYEEPVYEEPVAQADEVRTEQAAAEPEADSAPPPGPAATG